MILAVLTEGPAHGYGIIKAVEARSRSGVLLDPANLYRVLRRMRRAGWIGEMDRTWGEKDSPASGETPAIPGNNEARRRTYAITPKGRALLASELARLERLLEQARPALARGKGG